jgi:F-type H+-transporting ATPase subunit O
MSAHKGEIEAKVTTAKSLDARELKDLQAVLQTFVKSGNTLKLETKVDPTLIGGMVVELGDRYIDLSISSRLRTYESIVKETL